MTKEEKIKELKEWYGWTDELINKLTPRDLQAAYKIMELEKEEGNVTHDICQS